MCQPGLSGVVGWVWRARGGAGGKAEQPVCQFIAWLKG